MWSHPALLPMSLCFSLAAMVLGALSRLFMFFLWLIWGLGFRKRLMKSCIFSSFYLGCTLAVCWSLLMEALATQWTQQHRSDFSTTNYSFPLSYCTLWKEVTQPTLPEAAECINEANSSKWETYSFTVPEKPCPALPMAAGITWWVVKLWQDGWTLFHTEVLQK